MPSPLRIALSIGASGGSFDARSLARYGARAEELGFSTLWLGDHLYTSAPTEHAVAEMAVLANATERVPIGFDIYVLPLRHPLMAAKELTALDQLSGGRLIAGLGAGSNAREFETFGIPFSERGERLDEGIDALKQLWTGESVTFAGKFYHFSNAKLAPLPVQQPHPPIWLGSWSGTRRNARRIVRHAAGWQASGLHTTVEEFRQGWAQVKAAAKDEGRDPATIRKAYVNAITWLDSDRERAWETVRKGQPGTLPPFRQDVELRLIGTPDDAIARLRELWEAGVEEVALRPPASAPDQIEIIAREIMPAFC